MKLCKAILLLIGLAMVATLVACSSSSTSTTTPPPPTIAISATGGTPQTATVNKAFQTALQATVTSNGSPDNGVTVTFSAPSSGASCTLANTTATTNSSGVASTTCTANSTAGAYNVTAAASGATGNATFSLTNVLLSQGNYAFYISGTDSGAAGSDTPGPYFLAGAFTVNSQGQITGGLQDFSDSTYVASAEAITGGSVVPSTTQGDTNLTITINTADTNIGPGASTLGSGTGTIVLDVSMASTTRGLAIEYDTWASGKGELDLQTSTGPLCSSASSSSPCGYAFAVGGIDFYELAIGVGGVVAIDSAGGISGNGSVFDSNDFCGDYNSSTDTCTGESFADNTFTASTVVSPSTNPYGFVTFTLNSSLYGSPGMILDGYIIDANHILLVENWLNLTTSPPSCNDGLCATTGGLALAQTGTGTFDSGSISGSNYVVSLFGQDPNGALQSAAVLDFNSSGSTIGGNLSFNDIAVQNAQGGEQISGGTWSIDGGSGCSANDCGDGRVTVTGVTDTTADFLYNLQLYLTGNGHALVISMDAGNTSSTPDVIGGPGWQQTTGLTVGSFDANYAYADDAFAGGAEVNDVGVISSNGSNTITGFIDDNPTIAGGVLTPDGSLSASYAATSTNGVFNVTGSGSSATPLTAYIVDDTQGVVIENDDVQLTLGYFANQ